MRNTRVFLITGIIFAIPACSMESLQRAGYDSLQTIRELQCQKDLSKDLLSECLKRDSYETYQRKMKELETSQ